MRSLTGLVAPLKRVLFPSGLTPRVHRGGLLRGLKLEIDFDGQTQQYLGLFEREIQGAVRRLAGRASTVIDVGAAEGTYSIYMLARTSARRVIAFEPSPARDGFIHNLRLNGLEEDPRLVLRKEFVGEADGPSTCTLDSLLPDLQFPCLLKVDVDGAEDAVLHGARALMERPGTAWVIETHSAELERECLAILERNGYRAVVVPNAWWRRWIPEGRKIAHNRWIVAEK